MSNRETFGRSAKDYESLALTAERIAAQISLVSDRDRMISLAESYRELAEQLRSHTPDAGEAN